MKRHLLWMAVIVLVAAAGLRGRSQGAGQAPMPDLIIHNAKVVTVDAKFSIARAAAIAGGRFVAVGDDAAVLALAGPQTKKVDLRGMR